MRYYGEVSYLKLVRPKQFVKNLLIIAVPVSAGRIFEVEILTKTILTIVLFSLASAGIYIYNDFFDKEFDKRHLHKKNRPIAAGEVNETLSLILATVLILLSLIFSYLFIGIQMLILLIIYFVIQFFYFFIGKQIHTLEIFIVASGFVLRAIAGGVSTGIYISPWFNVLVGTTAIFIVAAKRYSEYINSSNFETRVVLKFYSAAYLRTIWETTLTASIILYILWSFNSSSSGFDTYSLLSTVPFVLILFFYAKKTDANKTEAPEEIIYKDKAILLLSFIWLLIILYRGSQLV